MYQATSKSPASCTRQIPQEPHFVPEPPDPANCSPPETADTRLKRPDAQRFLPTFQAGPHTSRRFFQLPRSRPQSVAARFPHKQTLPHQAVSQLQPTLRANNRSHRTPSMAPGTAYHRRTRCTNDHISRARNPTGTRAWTPKASIRRPEHLPRTRSSPWNRLPEPDSRPGPLPQSRISAAPKLPPPDSAEGSLAKLSAIGVHTKISAMGASQKSRPADEQLFSPASGAEPAIPVPVPLPEPSVYFPRKRPGPGIFSRPWDTPTVPCRDPEQTQTAPKIAAKSRPSDGDPPKNPPGTLLIIANFPLA